MNNILITHYSNPTKEGIVIHTNYPSKLRSGNILSTEHFVSWDKIGSLILRNYSDETDINELNKLRNSK